MPNPSQLLNATSDPREREAGEKLLAAGVEPAVLERTSGRWLTLLRYIPQIVALLEQIIEDWNSQQAEAMRVSKAQAAGRAQDKTAPASTD